MSIAMTQRTDGMPIFENALKPIQTNLLFDPTIEFNHGIVKNRLWGGIFHIPPIIKDFFNFSHEKLFKSEIWKRSEDYFKIGFTFSNHLKTHLEQFIKIPICKCIHPIVQENYKLWDEYQFLTNENRRIYQLGWYFRNTIAINQLPIIPGYQKVRGIIPPDGSGFRHHENSIRYWQKRPDERQIHGGVIKYTRRLSNEEYDNLMCRDVMFAEFFDASANISILECIIRNTPVVVNRLPAIEEYLGPKYPLFYDEWGDAPKLFNDDLICEAHAYLKKIDKSIFDPVVFRKSVIKGLQNLTNRSK